MTTFNPTLVRLRRHIPERGWQASEPFQSHLGSIAARQRVSFSSPRWRWLSIPPWFDCGVAPRGRVYTTYDFQSHLGSIAAYRNWHFIPNEELLSIPPWFDCGRQVSTAPYGTCTPFNPTLVRLRLGPWHFMLATCNPLSIPPWFDCGQGGSPGWSIPVLCFQSHLGSIAANICFLSIR